ncbi:ABC transporter ATP-binding protein [Pelotomaculum terephthalicicum JT]|uniref:ABC transporter ATP-binding protein n=1 Tax=Pelotomaculum terephthalicicum TaxID=206393 RepID=UPI0009D44FD2|nr:ABC transporter ATP-binding protein [Pelotomaculum terephthalicicum]MCG9969404.1 ABC transporter ATP-binding protein [Pelotomaculum terephthalicicum JT]OPY63101.1 MAG: ABC-type transporter ATP-binding protein EcsA [Pelotomaculum sp. PtaU1.Bin065]
MENEYILEIQHLTKKFSKKTAVDDLHFSLRKGETVGLLGPNGAGKSTLIKCIVGLLRPTSGNIFIAGNPRGSRKARQVTAYIPEVPQLYNMLTVWEHLRFITDAYEIARWEERAGQLLRLFEIWEQRDEFVKTLSKGMRQKLSLCCGIISGARILFFDEPMVGLDPRAIKNFKDLIQELKEGGRTLFISTHLLDPIENICSRIIVLKKGKIIADGSLEELRSRLGEENASLEEVFLEVTADA